MSWLKNRLAVLRARLQTVICCQIPARYLKTVVSRTLSAS